MREVKFRFFDKKANAFIKPENDYDYNWLVKHDGTPCRVYNDSCQVALKELDNIIVSQYTGLKDKNGIEIHEGDIIEYQVGINPRTARVKKIIVYHRDGFYFGNKNGKSPCKPGVKEWKRCHIIGNIYENPELIN